MITKCNVRSLTEFLIKKIKEKENSYKRQFGNDWQERLHMDCTRSTIVSMLNFLAMIRYHGYVEECLQFLQILTTIQDQSGLLSETHLTSGGTKGRKKEGKEGRRERTPKQMKQSVKSWEIQVKVTQVFVIQVFLVFFFFYFSRLKSCKIKKRENGSSYSVTMESTH